ncbi:MAG: TolB family protein [Bacteroidales bacterium]|nr:TolB family protein [Bacteroidales bacterium]
MQYRVTPGANTEQFTASVEGASVLQLERKGNIITVSVALKGKPLQQVGSYEFNFPEEAYIGLFVCAHNPDVIEAAEFSNVRLVVPAFEGFKPYQDYGHSRLEILEVETGLRKVIYSTEDPIEAPNWSRDGTYLIYNSKGLLFKIAANGGEPKQIPTDFAIRNNNDHGISFDGKKLAISHHAEDRPEGNNSTVYVLPIEGGTPKEMTSKSPSYWHGWSPDDQWLVYTGGRDGQYDIYKISINGGEEIRLTEADALDDGPEFSPDGKFIYFNSSRSGKMQIWRMNPDGSNQEQITKDEFNNWFAHPSPDGKQIIILSYPEDIKADDHPHYKHVMLRLLSPDGAEPVVKAYIYGGQGTINVPSWSPDSKKVAFVSYTFGKP